jgi:tetratricopeptide (TPR) repeat protein
MNRRRITLLLTVLAIETVLIAWCINKRIGRPTPPRLPADGMVDAETARDFQRLWILAENPGRGDWLALGQAFAVYGFFPQADQCLKQAIQLEPDSANNWFWSGLVLNRLGQTTRSTRQLIQAARLDPVLTETCHYIAARNHLRNDSPELAEAELRQIGTAHLAGQYLLAYLLVHTDRPSDAVPLLDALIAKHSDVHRLYQLRARAAEALGNSDMARQDRQTAERLPQTIATDAVADQLAERSFEFGLEKRILQAGRLNTPGNLQAVVNELKAILEISYRPRVARLLASIELQRRQPESAVKLLQQMTKRDGATADSLIELGLAMDAAGHEPTRVFQIFQQALQYRLDPEICRLMTPFVKTQSNQADVDRLEALRQHAAGLQAFSENRLNQAVKLFETAASTAHQRQADSNFFLGECLRLLEHPQAALDAYRRCLELRPHHGRAADALDRYGKT